MTADPKTLPERMAKTMLLQRANELRAIAEMDDPEKHKEAVFRMLLGDLHESMLANIVRCYNAERKRLKALHPESPASSYTRTRVGNLQQLLRQVHTLDQFYNGEHFSKPIKRLCDAD